MISDQKVIDESLNNFFIDSIKNLDIESFLQTIADVDCHKCILKIIKEYEYHLKYLKN